MRINVLGQKEIPDRGKKATLEFTLQGRFAEKYGLTKHIISTGFSQFLHKHKVKCYYQEQEKNTSTDSYILSGTDR